MFISFPAIVSERVTLSSLVSSLRSEMLPTSLCARVQQQVPASLYICGFYCKKPIFSFFFPILHVFWEKKCL